MGFHRARGDEQKLRDLVVGVALGRQTSDAQLARGECVAAAQGVTARPRTRDDQLLAGLLGQRDRAVAMCQVEPAAQVVARL